MRVPTRTTSDNVIGQLQRLGTQQARLQKQVSTNQRIFLPSDDPAAMGRMLAIGNEQNRIAQFQRNIDVASNLAQATYTGLKSLSDLASRAGELATLGRGTLGAEATQAYAAEVDQLLEQAVQLGNTRFGGDYLFAGTALNAEPITVTRDAAGRVTGAAYAGNTQQASVALSETASLAPRTDGTTNLGIRDFVNQLVALRDALDANDPASVAVVGDGLESTSDVLTAGISQNGAVQMRIQVAKSQQNARGDDLEKLASSEADGDLASAVVKLSQTTTTYEAAMASASKIMNLSLLDYLR